MPSKKAIFFIIYHYLILSWANKKKYRNGSAVGILLPILGVAIGVFAFAVVLSIMGGFVKNIQNDILNMQAHISIVSRELAHQIPADNGLIPKIKSISPEILEVTPYQSGDLILEAGRNAVMANLQSASFSPLLDKQLPAMNIENSAEFPTVILSQELMQQLGIEIGNSITLVSTQPDDGPGGMAPMQLPVVVAGVMDSGNFSYDKKMLFSSLKTADLFFGTENSWLGFQLKLKDPFQADEIAHKLSKELPSNLKAKPWTEENKALLRALALEHYGMSFVIGMIILVGCFSISISLLLSVRRKSTEMAILRSMGFEKNDLSKLYLLQGFFIGLIGVVLGLITGGIVLYILHHYRLPFITSSYSSEPLPVLVSVQDIVFVSVGSLLRLALAKMMSPN